MLARHLILLLFSLLKNTSLAFDLIRLMTEYFPTLKFGIRFTAVEISLKYFRMTAACVSTVRLCRRVTTVHPPVASIRGPCGVKSSPLLSPGTFAS